MVPPPEFPFLKFWLQTTQKFQLTVKLLQGPDQVLGTCSGSIGEQNLTRLSMLILRQTLFLVMRNGFPPIGYWRSVSLWIYLATLTKALPQNHNITIQGQCESVCYIWRRCSGDVYSDKTRGGKWWCQAKDRFRQFYFCNWNFCQILELIWLSNFLTIRWMCTTRTMARSCTSPSTSWPPTSSPWTSKLSLSSQNLCPHRTLRSWLTNIQFHTFLFECAFFRNHDLLGDNSGEHRSMWINTSCANVWSSWRYQSNFGLFALTSHLLMSLRSTWICLDLE